MSMPGGPLDLPSTQALIEQRIRRGEITQNDVDILKRGYRWMILSATLGAGAGIPVWYSLKRRTPRLALGTRLLGTWFVTTTGSFLGFTIGGAAAALEVNNHMTDSQRKMKVFEDVMQESKRISEEQRMTGISRNPRDLARTAPGSIYDDGASSSGSRMSDDLQGVAMSSYDKQGSGVWDAEANEKRQELDRENQYVQGGAPGIRGATSSTWDRIRAGETPNVGSPDRPSDRSARPSTSPFSSSSHANAPMSDSRAAPDSRQSFGQPTNLSSQDLDIKIDTLGSKAGDLGSKGEIYGLAGTVQERDREREREKREFEMLVEKERNAGSQNGREDGFEVGKWR